MVTDMYERVSPAHPDKMADRIAGALVDLAYTVEVNPRIAVEVLIGHETCTIVYESDLFIDENEVKRTVCRITNTNEFLWDFTIRWNPQDPHLAENQDAGLRCGDNGIFRGCPVTEEQRRLANTMREVYGAFPYDGKAILDNDRIILCQSHVEDYHELLPFLDGYSDYLINPLGPWTGGPDVDTGATNRKLGSDMGDAVTGGGLHGKDLSKADVSVNIMCHLLAQESECDVTASCAIGDEGIVFAYDGDRNDDDPVPYEEVVRVARGYVNGLGGFERLAEWGLI